MRETEKGWEGWLRRLKGKIELAECYWWNLGRLERLSLSTPGPLIIIIICMVVKSKFF